MKRFDNYLFRCSSLGNIMTDNSKTTITAKQETTLRTYEHNIESGKGITDKQNAERLRLIAKRDTPPKLSIGSKTHCEDLLKGELFNRQRSFHSKYTDKGNEVEEMGLTLTSNVLNSVMFKNEKHYKNDYIKGTPDVVGNTLIRDIKCSWDLHTFPMFKEEMRNNLYEWQVKGYAWLTGCTRAQVVYCLVNTPHNIINDELRRLDWAISTVDGNGNIYTDKIPDVVDKLSMMIYTREGIEKFCFQDPNIKIEWFDDFIEIPEKLRVKKHEIDLQIEDIDRIKEQVILSREYMNDLHKKINTY